MLSSGGTALRRGARRTFATLDAQDPGSRERQTEEQVHG
jgi:hypothetical protein